MKQSLTLAQQARVIQQRFPKVESWRRVVLGHEWLCFKLNLRPCEVCKQYEVLFAYTPTDRPHVWVVEPEPVKSAHGQQTPHLNYDGTLCLFDPEQDEWSPSEAFAHTIVPWSSRWLFHYENWLVSGVWRGDSTDARLDSPSGISAADVQRGEVT